IGLITGAASSDRGLPLIRVAGYDAVGAPNSLPWALDPIQNVQLTQRFTILLGRHELKAGAEFRRAAIHSVRDAGFRGSFYFHSLEDFLVGRVGIERIARGDSRRDTTLNTGAWYAQDTARLPRDLT